MFLSGIGGEGINDTLKTSMFLSCSDETYELPLRNPSCLPPKLMCFHFVPFMLYERLPLYGWHINTKCTVFSHNGKFSPFLPDTVFQRP